jgi:hypothetical protein
MRQVPVSGLSTQNCHHEERSDAAISGLPGWVPNPRLLRCAGHDNVFKGPRAVSADAGGLQ